MHLPESVVLEMRPGCECCDVDLPPSSTEAWICSFECTWCSACATDVLHGRCRNCGGDLARRPTRAPEKLAGAPASTRRVLAADCR